MTYCEKVKKLREDGYISTSLITGADLFMFLHDHAIKYISGKGCIYEINFLPTEINEAQVYVEVNDKICPDFEAGCEVMKKLVNAFNDKATICMNLMDELFNIEMELMETDE